MQVRVVVGAGVVRLGDLVNLLDDLGLGREGVVVAVGDLRRQAHKRQDLVGAGAILGGRGGLFNRPRRGGLPYGRGRHF